MSTSQHKTETVRARVEPKIRKNAEHVLSELGISMSDAIRIFLNQIALRQAFPVELKLPNKTTLQAIEAPVAEEVFESAEQLFASVKSDDTKNQSESTI